MNFSYTTLAGICLPPRFPGNAPSLTAEADLIGVATSEHSHAAMPRPHSSTHCRPEAASS